MEIWSREDSVSPPVELHQFGQLDQPGQTTEEGAVMTIQNFSEALNSQDSNLHQAFEELRGAGVRHAIENPPPGTDGGGWLQWQ